MPSWPSGIPWRPATSSSPIRARSSDAPDRVGLACRGGAGSSAPVAGQSPSSAPVSHRSGPAAPRASPTASAAKPAQSQPAQGQPGQGQPAPGNNAASARAQPDAAGGPELFRPTGTGILRGKVVAVDPG